MNKLIQTINGKEVVFNPERHIYTVDGEVYPSVTTILGLLDKSAPLMGWAAKVLIAYLENKIESIKDGELILKSDNASELLKEAKREYRRISQEARDVGKEYINL